MIFYSARTGLVLALGSFGSLGAAPIQGALLGPTFIWWKATVFSGVGVFLVILLMFKALNVLIDRYDSLCILHISYSAYFSQRKRYPKSMNRSGYEWLLRGGYTKMKLCFYDPFTICYPRDNTAIYYVFMCR